MKGVVFLLCLVVILFSCEKMDLKVDNLDSKLYILGHGGIGVGKNYPMNTFESIQKCFSLGADGTEIDVQLTKDSVLIAFRGKDLSDYTQLTGAVNDYNWSEIKGVQYTSLPYLGYEVLALEDLFERLNNVNQYKYTFDCKLYTNQDGNTFQKQFANALERLIEKYKLEEQVYIESQQIEFLQLLKVKNLHYKLFIYPSSFKDGLATALEQGLYGITISTDLITKEQVELAHSYAIYVAVWNTHSRKRNKEAIAKHPDFIQTDLVGYLVGEME